MLSDSNARLGAARGLTSPRGRREAGRFLAEGAQAVREALLRPGTVLEVFATAAAAQRHADLLEHAPAGSVALISDRAAASLSETVHPQGLIAVCATLEVSLAEALGRTPRLVAVLVEANDPGNAGAILRTADAAGAGAVLFTGDSVDPYNGKAVRASAGSLFHLDLVTGLDPAAAIAGCRAAGLLTLATTGTAAVDLDELIDQDRLRGRTAWIFGNEARGLPADLIRAAELPVRVPVHGGAESLNLAAAAAVCLYASARANRFQALS
ncbi:MAG: methyltransferase, TrmH family [Pseudonocardiales bacterium]|nr:methyltransferase, TrmH family [Pseudonocardiales bacterium]